MSVNGLGAGDAGNGLIESRPKTGMRVRRRENWNFLDADVLSWALSGDTLEALRAASSAPQMAAG